MLLCHRSGIDDISRCLAGPVARMATLAALVPGAPGDHVGHAGAAAVTHLAPIAAP